MYRHPPGIQVDIVGIEEGSSGRSCEEHTVCGEVLEVDMPSAMPFSTSLRIASFCLFVYDFRGILVQLEDDTQ